MGRGWALDRSAWVGPGPVVEGVAGSSQEPTPVSSKSAELVGCGVL